MTIIPAENHPGHSLLGLTELPPGEAIEAWRDQLNADLDSRRTTGVLIHGGFVGSDYQDHGVSQILELLALALASSSDWMFMENNGDERDQPLDALMSEMFEELPRWLLGNLEHEIRQRYVDTLIALEEERRREEAEDAVLD